VSTEWTDEEARIWRAWREAVGMRVETGPSWGPSELVGWTGVLAWPVRLHPLLHWLQPPLHDRPSPPETFADLAAALAEAPVPTGGTAGYLVDPSCRTRVRQGSPKRTAYGPVLRVGTAIRIDGFYENPCAGPWTWIEATVVGTPIGNLPVSLPVDRAGVACLVARLAVVDRSDPLASDHARAEELHRRLIALVGQAEGDDPAGETTDS
jgi:hypothetical protein